MWLFFIRFFDSLKKKEQLAPSIASLIERFNWETVCAPLTNGINRISPHDAMDLALALVKACNHDGNAQAGLTTLAVEKAQLIPGAVLASSKSAYCGPAR